MYIHGNGKVGKAFGNASGAEHKLVRISATKEVQFHSISFDHLNIYIFYINLLMLVHT